MSNVYISNIFFTTVNISAVNISVYYSLTSFQIIRKVSRNENTGSRA